MLVGSAYRSVWGVLEPFFNPSCDSLTTDTKRAGQTTEARAFLRGVEDGLFFFFAVGVGSWVFAVLFVAGAALVTLSAIRGKTVLDEVVALAVRAGQGDCDWHVAGILT